MNTKPKHMLIKRLISMALVLAMTCVYVVADNYAPIVTDSSEPESNKLLAQTLSYSTGLLPETELTDVSELVLAENTTNMGKVSQSLSEAFADMPDNVKSGDELDKTMADFSRQIANLKAQTLDELRDTDNGSAEFSEYRDTVISGYNDLEDLLSTVTIDNYESVMADISALIMPERPYVSLADDLPFNDVSEENISYAEYNPEAVTNYSPADGEYSDEDLVQTNDTVINDDVRNEFFEYESVLEVYHYIKNNYMMEFYFGSRKGAAGTSAEKAGNDYDIASLLIGVLRDRNIPARYASGEIEITAEQAMEWTATDDVNVAMRVISSLGIPATGMISDGETVAVRLEHVWVEAYVPYTDYRGTGNRSGERLWIPLDASFKEMIHNDGVALDEIKDYLNDPANQITESTEIFDVNIGYLAELADGGNSAFIKYILENGYAEATMAEAFGGTSILSADLGYLPLSLPYRNIDSVSRYEDIPEELTDSVSFRLYGNSAVGSSFNGTDSINQKFLAPDVYGKRIVLSYIPASDTDKEILEKYGNIFSAPAYLVKLKPQLSVDGEVVKTGDVCNAGYLQQYDITIYNGAPSANESNISNNIEAGGMYCIAMDYGNISSAEIEKVAEYIDSQKENTSEENIYTEEIMGGMLNSLAKLYFAQLDLYNKVIAGQKNVTSARALSIGIVGFKANVEYMFSRPSEINEGGFFLDIGHDSHSVVSNVNNRNDEKTYMLQSGIYASAMEHGVLEQVTGVESVSTIKTFQYAQENNIPMHMIVRENISDELEAITVSSQVKNDIRTAVNSGKIVIIPETEISINQWNGVGYMVLDTDTFACGYMISGGLAGGSMTAGQMIGEYVGYVIEGVISVIAWELFKTLALAMCPCGWVAAIGFLINLTEFVMMVDYVWQLVDLWNMYQATGEIYYLQELGVQVAAFATLSIASKLFGNKLENLKESINKAVNEAGLAGKCFVAGTLVATTLGLIPIENVSASTIVYSFDPITFEVSEKQVEEVFVNESNKLIDIDVNGETIQATPDHPFYVPKKGFTKAVDLRAGDVLCTVNGEYVVIEKIQHEILNIPVKVYNFRVSDNHTYFVGTNSVLVHNDCMPSENYLTKTDTNGDKTYTRTIDGKNVDIKYTYNAANGKYYPRFEEYAHPKYNSPIEAKFKMTGDQAYDSYYMNKQVFGNGSTKMDGYTWHHLEDGKSMILVETKIHMRFHHQGGAEVIRGK